MTTRSSIKVKARAGRRERIMDDTGVTSAARAQTIGPEFSHFNASLRKPSREIGKNSDPDCYRSDEERRLPERALSPSSSHLDGNLVRSPLLGPLH
jgi:hypothetical protein